MSPRRVERQNEIQVKACELVLQRGFAGFTMDDLAEAVGCSRRTLFNYVPDKASAVIGAWDETVRDNDLIAGFEAGGPTGALYPDAVQTIADLIRSYNNVSIDHGHTQRLIEAAIRADPKVNQLVGDRFHQLAELLAATVCRREHWTPGDLRARALAASLFGLLLTALGDLAQDPEGTALANLFTDAVAADEQARACRRPVMAPV